MIDAHRAADRRRDRRLHASSSARCVTTEEAEADARALMDQWGVGRERVRRRPRHPVRPPRRTTPATARSSCTPAPAIAATFLANSERQAIFENDMLPLLQRLRPRRGAARGDAEGRRERDARARRHPQLARQLERGRSASSVAPLVLFVLIVGARADRWLPVRTRPGLPRRPLDPHPRPAGRPHPGGGRGHPRREVDRAAP